MNNFEELCCMLDSPSKINMKLKIISTSFNFIFNFKLISCFSKMISLDALTWFVFSACREIFKHCCWMLFEAWKRFLQYFSSCWFYIWMFSLKLEQLWAGINAVKILIMNLKMEIYGKRKRKFLINFHPVCRLFMN